MAYLEEASRVKHTLRHDGSGYSAQPPPHHIQGRMIDAFGACCAISSSEEHECVGESEDMRHCGASGQHAVVVSHGSCSQQAREWDSHCARDTVLAQGYKAKVIRILKSRWFAVLAQDAAKRKLPIHSLASRLTGQLTMPYAPESTPEYSHTLSCTLWSRVHS